MNSQQLALYCSVILLRLMMLVLYRMFLTHYFGCLDIIIFISCFQYLPSHFFHSPHKCSHCLIEWQLNRNKFLITCMYIHQYKVFMSILQ